jgi:thiamine-monophosphate kinase
MSDLAPTPLGPGGEFDRLRAVFARLGPRVAGVGDDAALVTIDGVTLALSCDLAIEGRHFRRDWLTAEEMGWRACAAALSDLAAMAAQPLGVLAAVGVPEGSEGAFLEELMEGVARGAAFAGAVVWGGDLVQAPAVTLDVSVVGRADRPVRRRGARPGDRVWVTGSLGAPAAAIADWEAGRTPHPALRARFARPVPRIAEAAWLRDRGATAMLDVSDGLVGDAGHLAAASGVGVVLEAEKVPVHGAVRAEGEEGAEGAERRTMLALQGGEEYELLVALPPAFGEAESRWFVRSFDLPLTCVGEVVAGAGVTVLRDGRPWEVGGGFSHFGA